MSNQLVRVQVYLDPKNIVVLDKLARQQNKTRSQVIRDAIDKHSKKEVENLVEKNHLTMNALLKMAGKGGKSKTGTLGLNIDEIYLND